jgi:hypothetical protein
MNMLKYIVIAIMSTALFGCPAARPKQLAQPETITSRGTYTHPASGMTFPIKIGDFERSTVYRHDTGDIEVSAGYDLISMAVSIAASVDVYPAPQLDTVGLPSGMVATIRENLSQQEFDSRKRELLSSHPGTVLIQEVEVSLPQSNNPNSGKMAVFEYEDIFFRLRQSLRTKLYLFCFASTDWIIKYQFTYPKNADALQDIDNFMMNLPWTLKRAVPSAPQ